MVKTQAAGSLKPGDRVDTYHYGPGTVTETVAHYNGGQPLVDITVRPDDVDALPWAEVTIRNEPASARWTLDESETAA